MANKKKHRRQKGGVMGMSHIPFSQRLQMQRAGEIGWSREHAARVTMWCFCVALHEKEGIAYKRIMRFAQRFTEIDEEFYDQEIEVSMEHAMQRALIVKTWNELLHMTTAERLELRTERLFWMRQGMKLYGVVEQTMPKLLKGRPLTIHTGYGSDTLDHAELVRTILARRYPNEEIKPTFCVRCFRDLRAGQLLCAKCGNWNAQSRPEPMYKGSWEVAR